MHRDLVHNQFSQRVEVLQVVAHITPAPGVAVECNIPDRTVIEESCQLAHFPSDGAVADDVEVVIDVDLGDLYVAIPSHKVLHLTDYARLLAYK